MVSIIPEKLKESEKGQTLSEWEWEKLLLERLLLRKELRLQNMQDKLIEQQKCIAENEDKIELINDDLDKIRERNIDMRTTIEKHENLPGFNVYLSFTNVVAIFVRKINIIASWISLIFSIIIQVLMFVACKFPGFVCLEATWVAKELAGRYAFVNQRLVENFQNEYLEKCGGNSDNIYRKTSKKKKYYKN